MADKFEQRAWIKFYFKLGKSPTETFAMLREAFQKHSLNKTQVFGGMPVSKLAEFHLKTITVQDDLHREFVPAGVIVNSDFYCDVLRRQRENVRRKRRKLWKDQNWLLHHDNAPAHALLKTTRFFTKNNMAAVHTLHIHQI